MLVALIAAASIAAAFGWSQPDAHGKAVLRSRQCAREFAPAPHSRNSVWMDFPDVGQHSRDRLPRLAGSAGNCQSVAHQTRQTLDFHRQCLAEGLANLAGGFFQCLPGSGSLTRSAINFQAGAVSRMSGIFAAGSVASVLLMFAPLMRYVP